MRRDRRRFLQASIAASTTAIATPLFANRSAAAHGTADPRPARPLDVLVLGGTRYLGPAVVRAALARGHRVTLFNRGRTQPWLFPGVSRRVGDRFPERGDGLSALAQGRWDVVMDLSGQYPRVIEATARLLEPRVDRYLMVSSVSVYRDLSQQGIDEDAERHVLRRPFEELPDLQENDWGTYGARKAAGEDIVRAVYGDRAILVRPCSICGGENNDGSGAYWTARLYRGGNVLAPGDGSDPTQLVDVRDLADFLVTAAERKLSGAYNVVGPADRLTLREYLASASAVAGDRGSVEWLGRFPEAMYGLPMAPPYHLVPGFSTMSNARAIKAGLRFRPLPDTLRSNWIDHRARRGDHYDFAAAGVGLDAAQEQALRSTRAPG